MTPARFETHPGGAAGLPYAVYLPCGYDAAAAWPLILILHGSGECGSDGARQLSQGLPPVLLAEPDRWRAIVVCPQKPSASTEWEEHEGAVLAAVARVRRRYRVDPSRLVLTGLSQGGHGALAIAARHPGTWAALVPVCGYAAARHQGPAAFPGNARQLAQRLAGTPVWAFHGEADDVVPAAETRAVVDALREAGARPRATFYPGVGHACWDLAYREPDLAGWVLGQRRPTPAAARFSPRARRERPRRS